MTASDYFDLDDLGNMPDRDPEDFGLSGNDDDGEPKFRHIKPQHQPEREGSNMSAPARSMSSTPATPPKAPSRMTLQNVTRGRIQQPLKVVLYGVEGIGKSTFGANAPKPIFLGAEDGTANLDVARLPKPESFDDVLDGVRALAGQHDFETLVIDTLDWIEPLIWRHVCARDEMADIEAYGYGKGYVTALDEWRRLLAVIEMTVRCSPMHVVMIAHSWIKPFKNPISDDFDRYEMKLHAKAGGLVKEWADAVLFANWQTFARKDERKRVRGVSTGARMIYTERTAAFDAKNRHSLPQEMSLSWEDFYLGTLARQVASPDELRAEIARKAKELGGEVEKKILETTQKAADDTQRLAAINNRVNALLAEKSEKES